jgi:nucleoside-diphosphate-sugar epimerase
MGQMTRETKAMRIVVTGAGGFLGGAIAQAAEAAGHSVVRILRSGAGEAGTVVQDLAAAGAAEALAAQIGTADAVIHAACEMGDDWALHQRSSLPAAKTVCGLAGALDAHLVHVSSIVVYDFKALDEGAIVTEQSPLEAAPEQRDGYVRAKLAIEEIVAQARPQSTVLRIGAIFGPGRAMNAHLGIGIGPLLLRLSGSGQIPLAHIGLAAGAAVRAAEIRAMGAVNVVDTDLPNRFRFIAALSRSGWPKLVVPVTWKIFDALARILGFCSGRPGLLRRAVLHARMKPLGYDNALMRRALGTADAPDFEVLMRRALRDG